LHDKREGDSFAERDRKPEHRSKRSREPYTESNRHR
jgi:hypothetical protein